MREAEFREWLEARRWDGKPLSSISSRMSKARRFERAMPALGLGEADLDAAFDEDGMEAVTAWLREACRSAATTDAAPAELVGTTANAGMRMANVASAVRNYRQFREAPPASDWPALDGLRAAFLDRVPEFERFTRTDNSYERIERTYKDAMAAKVREIAGSDLEDEEAGRRIYRALIPSQGALLSWQVDDHFARRHPDQAPAFYAEVGRLARRGGPIIDAILASAACFADLREEGASSLTIGQVARIALTVAGMVRPHESAPFAIGKAKALAKLLLGDALFVGSTLERSDLDRWLGLLARIETVMRADWGWEPRDLIDVQGFAWVALDEKWVEEEQEVTAKDVLQALEEMVVAGRLRRTSSENRLTKGIRYETRSGRQLQLELGNAVAKKKGESLYLDEDGQARATLVLKAGPSGIIQAPAGANDIAGVEYRTSQQYGGSHYKDGDSRLSLGRQACFYIDTLLGLQDLLDWYERDQTPIWLVTSRNGEADGLAHYLERSEWHLLEDRGSRMNDLVREMQPGDRIVLRDYVPYPTDLPFPPGNTRVTALRIRATGVVTEQRGDGMSVGVDWTVLPEPRTWYFYTNNDPVWRLKPDNEMAQKLAAFIFAGEPQDHAWFAARWFKEAAAPSPETVMPDPTNLILYGPPGTGKTYATAEHAIRLCGEEVPGERAALMATYARLVDTQRIAFVTFHQSFGYEDFVEGLRPAALPAGGFKLVVRNGIFKEMALRAQGVDASGEEDELVGEIREARMFRMSIGDAGVAGDERYFNEAIAAGDLLLSYNNIDWSDDRYSDRAAILETCNEKDKSRLHSLQTGDVKGVDLFRNILAIGDLVVVSRGRSFFRAIGRVTGDYRYVPQPDGRYCHRRSVDWLWHDAQGLPTERIYTTGFGIGGIEPLTASKLRRQAIEQLVDASGAEPGAATSASVDILPHVLIIDEINRANISKVFGELITLLEPDKRIGMTNELRITLPYSNDSFGVPRNLHVIGTMNTADRSIALIDKALRRRFEFVEMMPDYLAPGMDRAIGGVTLARLLEVINERIEYLLDREHQIGHGWLIGCTGRDDLDARMRGRIIPLIAEYFFEDWGRTADVLGGRRDNPFLSARTLSPPPGMTGEEPRTRWSVRPDFAENAYRRLVEGG